MNSTSFARWLLVIGLGLLVATGCGSDEPAEEECTVDADCGPEDEWNCVDGVCEAVEDICAGVTCPGGQTCDPETGECVGECCTEHTCAGIPNAECDEEKCLMDDPSVDPCVLPECPECGPNERCNTNTFECEPACWRQHDGCPEPYLRCEDDPDHEFYGQCVQRPVREGEVGWPCADDPTVCIEGTCMDQFQDPGIAFCSLGCSDDSQCPVGSFCDQGWCFNACDPDGYQDCAPGTQCIDGGTRLHMCLRILHESECEEDCLPAYSECDPDVADQCEAGLACLELTGGSFCQKLSCHYLDGGCPAGDRCFNLGINLSGCFEGCDPTEVEGCTDPNAACIAEGPIVGSRDTFMLAHSESDCTDLGYDALANPTGASHAYTCYASCPDEGCPGGQFCSDMVMFQGGDPIDVCVTYSTGEGTCDEGACADMGCTDLGTQDGTPIAACYLGCDSDDDCTDGAGGTCHRLTFTGGQSMQLCVYHWDDGYCLFSCEDDGEDCGYCESDADCGTFEVAIAGGSTTVAEKCDHATNTCRRPTTVDQIGSRCHTGQGMDPEGIEDADGNFSGACATECEDEFDCAGGACVEVAGGDKFCKPVPTVCNIITGQCEPFCDENEDCIHDACIGDRCEVACEGDVDGECGSDGVCFTDEEQNYCFIDCNIAGCPDGSQCDEDSGICIFDAEFTSLTAGDVDLLEEDGLVVTTGADVEYGWETENATGVVVYGVPYDDGCPDADDESWGHMEDYGPSGSDVVAIPGNLCTMAVAEGELKNATVIWWVLTAPSVEAGILAAVEGEHADTYEVFLQVETLGAVDLDVEAAYLDVDGELVGDAEMVCELETIEDGVQECMHLADLMDGDIVEIAYTAYAYDLDGDESIDAVALVVDELGDLLEDCVEDAHCDAGEFCNDDFECEPEAEPDCTIETQDADCAGLTPYCHPEDGICMEDCVDDANCEEGEQCLDGSCEPFA